MWNWAKDSGFFNLKCVAAQILHLEKSSWGIGQNALSQSDCRICKSDIYPEQIDETALFFACWYKFIRKLSKNFWLGMVKNGCGQSGHWTLKLTVSEEWTGINWFFACWYKSMQILIENWLNFFGGWLGQKWVWSVWWLDSKIDYPKKITDFLHVDADSQKLEADQKFFTWAWSNMGCGSVWNLKLTVF